MPKVPGIETYIPSARVQEGPRFGPSPIGPAIQRAGGEIAQLAGFLDQQDRETARVYGAKSLAKNRATLITEIEAKKQSGEPLTGLKTWAENRAAELFGEAAKNAPNQYARQAVEIDGIEAAAQFGVEGLRAEAEYNTVKTVSDASDTIDLSANILASRPDLFPKIYAETADFLKNIRLPIAERERLESKLKGLGVAAVAGQVERNPGGVLSELRAGKWDQFLDPNDKLTLINRAEAEIEHRQAEAEAAAAKARASAASAAANEIGMLTIQANDAANSGDVAGMQAARQKLMKIGQAFGFDKVDSQINSISDATAKVAAAANENARIGVALANGMLDPANADDRKGADAYYRAEVAPKLKGLEPADRAAALTSFAVQGGIIPETMQREVNAGLINGSEETAAYYAQVFDQIRAQNPQLVGQLSPDAQRKASLILNYASVGEQKPVEKAMEALKIDEPTRKARTEILQSTDTKKIVADFISNQKVDGAAVPPEMQNRFMQQFQAELEATGDIQTSMDTSWRQMSAVFGKTEIATTADPGGVMAYAPEKYFGRPGLSAEANSEWMREQLLSDVNEALGDNLSGVSAEDRTLILMRHPYEKGKDGLPVYAVMTRIFDADGVFVDDYPVRGKDGLPMAWRPDWSVSPAAAREEKGLNETVEEARKRRARGGVYQRPKIGGDSGSFIR